MKKNQSDIPKPGRGRLVSRWIPAALAALALASASVVVASQPAEAYALRGCQWHSQNFLRIDYRYVNGNFRTALSAATKNYNYNTEAPDLSVVDESTAFSAANSNYGRTGWEAQASISCSFGNVNNVRMQANQYYLSGSEPIEQLKVVWLHEIGHGLGLDHVSTVARVMYTSASTAYKSGGVRALTQDEINGINSMY